MYNLTLSMKCPNSLKTYNPHFFLNALNNLNSIIRLSPAKSEKYINTLADMMRYITYDCKNDLVSISKEVSYIKDYIYSQEIKDDDLDVIFSVGVENENTQIEPMLLMPFVENAFKYGVLDDTQKSPIEISIRQSNSTINFKCKNKINPNFTPKIRNDYGGLGIKNVKDRLEANYANRHFLQINKNNSFFEVNLVLNYAS